MPPHEQGQEVQGRCLIIADGATSKLATHMGYCTEPPKGVCSRAYVEGGTHNTKVEGARCTCALVTSLGLRAVSSCAPRFAQAIHNQPFCHRLLHLQLLRELFVCHQQAFH